MHRHIPIIFFLVLVLFSCDSTETNKNESSNLTTETSENITPDDVIQEVNVDLKQIKERGILRAITIYSSTSFFIYRGKPMGYEYELIKRLADHLGLELEIVVAENMNNLFWLCSK